MPRISQLPIQPSPSTSTALVGVDNGETVQIPITELVMSESTDDTVISSDNDIIINSGKRADILAAEHINIESDGANIRFIEGGDIEVSADEGIDLFSDNSMSLAANGDMTIRSEGNIAVTSSEEVKLEGKEACLYGKENAEILAGENDESSIYATAKGIQIISPETNVSNVNVLSTKSNGTGQAGQVLTSDGRSVYWADPSGGSGDSSIIDLGEQDTHKDAQQAMVDYISELTDEQGGVLFKYFCTCYGNACFAVVDYYRGSEGHYSCYGTVYDSMRSFREFVYSSDEGFSLDGCWHSIASFDEVFDELQTENKSVLGAIKEIHAIATNGYKPSSFYFTSLDDENTWIVGRDYDENRQEALIPSTWCGSPVTSIGDEAFYNCISLINVSIPNSITSIGNFAFRNCYSLTSVVIPDSVTSIGYYAFFDCPNLTIYCEAQSKPDGWDYRWNPDNCPVVWGYATDIMGVNKKLAEIGTGGSGGATLSMPRIKLASWYYDEIPVFDDMDASEFTSGRIVFSINVQDGTVQEGDQLQVCALRSVFGKKKIRPILTKTISGEDVENLAKQPYLQISTDDLSGNSLSDGMIKVLTSFFRTDSADSSKLKPKFIRIRRPIYKDGDDVDARFSNVEPVYIHLRYINLSEQLEEQISEQSSESE